MFFCIKHNTKRPNIIIGESKIQKPVSIHAEASGIKKLQDIYKEKHKILTYDLLVFRIFHNKSLHYSRPCYHCIRKLENSLFIKIRNVYYTAEPSLGKGNLTSGEATLKSQNEIKSQTFVDLLNQNIGENSDWKKWKLGEKGYPEIE